MGDLATVVETVGEAVVVAAVELRGGDDNVGRADRERGDVLHVGNNLVGEVGLHAVDAGHVKAVAIAVDIGIAVDVTVDVGITVVEANVAGHGATSAAESNNEVLHVWFGKSW